MARHPRMTLPIIAAAGIAAMLSATAPAVAESTVAAGKAAAVKTERVVVKPRAARRSPFVATQARQDRPVSPSLPLPRLFRRLVQATIRIDGGHRLLRPSIRGRWWLGSGRDAGAAGVPSASMEFRLP